MRLTESELRAIKAVMASELAAQPASLFLFGSRANDHHRGGDIDLLIVSEFHVLEMLRAKKYKILDDIHSLIGEQKIDLTLATPQQMRCDEFLVSIQPSLIQLI